VRDLLLGPKRFTDLQEGLAGAGPNILAQRLRELESVGVLRRRTLPPPAGSRVYELTEWGARLGPVIALLGGWGATSPVIPRSGDVGPDSMMLGLRNSFVAQPADPWSATYEFRFDRARFTFVVVEGELIEASRGQPTRPADAVVETDTGTLEHLLTARLTQAAATAAGRLKVTGDPDLVRRLIAAAQMVMPSPAGDDAEP
jgi:putative sterol carrier protein